MDVVELPSSYSFQTTVERLTAAIEAAGMSVFAHIDHAAAAEAAGLRMPRTIVLIYGNAKAGTPIMLVSPHASLDLPLRVLIGDDCGDRTVIAYHPVVPLLRRAGVPDITSSSLDKAQHLLESAV